MNLNKRRFPHEIGIILLIVLASVNWSDCGVVGKKTPSDDLLTFDEDFKFPTGDSKEEDIKISKDDLMNNGDNLLKSEGNDIYWPILESEQQTVSPFDFQFQNSELEANDENHLAGIPIFNGGNNDEALIKALNSPNNFELNNNDNYESGYNYSTVYYHSFGWPFGIIVIILLCIRCCLCCQKLVDERPPRRIAYNVLVVERGVPRQEEQGHTNPALETNEDQKLENFDMPPPYESLSSEHQVADSTLSSQPATTNNNN